MLATCFSHRPEGQDEGGRDAGAGRSGRRQASRAGMALLAARLARASGRPLSSTGGGCPGPARGARRGRRGRPARRRRPVRGRRRRPVPRRSRRIRHAQAHRQGGEPDLRAVVQVTSEAPQPDGGVVDRQRPGPFLVRQPGRGPGAEQAADEPPVGGDRGLGHPRAASRLASPAPQNSATAYSSASMTGSFSSRYASARQPAAGPGEPAGGAGGYQEHRQQRRGTGGGAPAHCGPGGTPWSPAAHRPRAAASPAHGNGARRSAPSRDRARPGPASAASRWISPTRSARNPVTTPGRTSKLRTAGGGRNAETIRLAPGGFPQGPVIRAIGGTRRAGVRGATGGGGRPARAGPR